MEEQQKTVTDTFTASNVRRIFVTDQTIDSVHFSRRYLNLSATIIFHPWKMIDHNATPDDKVLD